MRKLAVLAGLGGVLLLALGSYALAGGGSNNARGGKLVGYQEVPSVSTAASGTFEARLVGNSIEYKLSYKSLEGSVTQATSTSDSGLSTAVFRCFSAATCRVHLHLRARRVARPHRRRSAARSCPPT